MLLSTPLQVPVTTQTLPPFTPLRLRTLHACLQLFLFCSFPCLPAQLGSTPKEWRMATAARPRVPPKPQLPPAPTTQPQVQQQQQRAHHLTQLAQQQGMLPPSQQPTPTPTTEQTAADFDDHMMGMSPENVFMPPRTAGQQFGRLSSGLPMNAMRTQQAWTSSPMIIHSSAI